MKQKRILFELLICCVLSSVLVHSIPKGYEVRQTYSISGNRGVPEEIPSRLTSAVRTALRGRGTDAGVIAGLRCSQGSTAERFTCSTLSHRRSLAAELSAVLKESVPSKIGWLPAENLRIRARETQAKLTQWSQEVASAVRELAALEPEVADARKKLDGVRARKASLENDLSNRKKQLEILEEAIPDQTAGQTRTRFESKRGEVVGIIRSLQIQLDLTDGEILRLTRPADRKREIEEVLPTLRAQIDLARAQIASWSPLLSKTKTESLLADPDGFQLAPVIDGMPLTPLRSWSHLFWSFPLGLFFLSLIRWRRLSDWQDRYFQTPEEVVSETGLPFLGPV
jgi:hypothetical protein